MKKLGLLFMIAFSTLTLAACGEQETTERLQVVATTTFMGDLVYQVTGDLVDLHVLMAPGVDPHDFVPTQSDTARLQAADLVVVNGLDLEERMGQVLTSLGSERVIVLGEMLDEAQLLFEDDEGVFDPHIWFDVRLWATLPPLLAARLGTLEPNLSSTFEARAQAYVNELMMLDQWIRQQVEAIPQAQRILITAHDAFAYFGRAYDFEVYAIQGISTEGEASIADIEALAALMQARNVTAVFFETTIPEQTVQALVQAANALGHEARVGGALFSDSTGSFEEGLETLIRAMHHNVQTILSALGE